MKNIQSKKGMSIGDMYPAVLTIVLVGIVLGVGLYVLSTFHTQITPDVSGAQNLINCSTPTTLTVASLANFNLESMDSVINSTGATKTSPANYNVTSAGVITWSAADDAACTGSSDLMNVTFTYTYDATDSAQESVTTTISGLATFADWIAIIVVVIAAAIVLGIVLSNFGRGRNNI